MLKIGDIIQRTNSKGKTNIYKVKRIKKEKISLKRLELGVEFETNLSTILKAGYEKEIAKNDTWTSN